MRANSSPLTSVICGEAHVIYPDSDTFYELDISRDRTICNIQNMEQPVWNMTEISNIKTESE